MDLSRMPDGCPDFLDISLGDPAGNIFNSDPLEILGDGQQAGHIGKLHVGEHNFMNDRIYEAYFGVTEDEVRDLFREYKSVSFEELKQWYDGYRMSDGRRLFNPRSVLTHIFAIAQNNEGKEWIQKTCGFPGSHKKRKLKKDGGETQLHTVRADLHDEFFGRRVRHSSAEPDHQRN